MNRIASHKANVTAAFSAAAETYERGAEVQLKVAERLTERVAALPLPTALRILEIGCGTGFLTRCLREHVPNATWTVTDISQAMLSKCEAGLGDTAGMTFKLMDGEAPDLSRGETFDLICSSLTMQWFENLPVSLQRLSKHLNPGGHIAFSTLATDSFREWHAAYEGVEEPSGVLECLSVPEIEAALPNDGTARIDEEHILQPYDNGLAFLGKLRQIGAQSPRKGHSAASPATLRKVLRAFDADPRITYHVAYGIFTKR